MTSTGSTTFPIDLLILRPCPSRTCAGHQPIVVDSLPALAHAAPHPGLPSHASTVCPGARVSTLPERCARPLLRTASQAPITATVSCSRGLHGMLSHCNAHSLHANEGLERLPLPSC